MIHDRSDFFVFNCYAQGLTMFLLSVCHFLPLSVSLSVCNFVSQSLSLSVYQSLSLSTYQSLFVFVSLSF